MKVIEQPRAQQEPESRTEHRDLIDMLSRSVGDTTCASHAGIVVGEVVGLIDGATPLVMWPTNPSSAAVAARTVVDICGAHVGRQAVLMFESADCSKPVIMGLLTQAQPWPTEDRPLQVEVDADGRRLTITAAERIVFRCGKASLTMTKTGKVLLQGTYVSSRSSGVNRIEGGSVQIN